MLNILLNSAGALKIEGQCNRCDITKGSEFGFQWD
jgi:hypothetical protein